MSEKRGLVVIEAPETFAAGGGHANRVTVLPGSGAVWVPPEFASMVTNRGTETVTVHVGGMTVGPLFPGEVMTIVRKRKRDR